MPFDMCDIKPPTVYSNHLKDFYDKFSQKAGSRAPFDRYDNTGGSFPVRPSHCKVTLQPTIRGNEKTYIAKYLRANLLTSNPGTLCAIKNTRILKGLLEYSPIEFVPPKFGRGPCRSTTHLELDAKYERTLCTIQENLRDQQKNLRALDLQKRAKKLQKFVNDTRSEHSTGNESFMSSRIFTNKIINKSRQGKSQEIHGPKQQRRRRSSIGAEKTKELIEICQKGDLLNHIRDKVIRRYEQKLESEARVQKQIMPNVKTIPFPVEGSRKEGGYEYPSHGAMASVCTNRRSANEFFESKSDKELRYPKTSEERIHRLSMPSHGKYSGLPKGLSFSPSLFDNVHKAATPDLLKKFSFKMPPKTSPNPEFSHLGLIEAAKEDIVADLRSKMARREPVVTPKWLSTSHYGPLKNVPENPLKGPLMPVHLAVRHFPPTEEEMERVERLMAKQKVLDKEKRRLRVCKGDAYYTPFTKPLLTDSEEDEVNEDSSSLQLSKMMKDYKIDSDTLFKEIEDELTHSLTHRPQTSSKAFLQSLKSKSYKMSSSNVVQDLLEEIIANTIPTKSTVQFQSTTSLEKVDAQSNLLPPEDIEDEEEEDEEEEEIEEIESFEAIKPPESPEEASSAVHISSSAEELEMEGIPPQQQSSADRLPSKTSLDIFAEIRPSEVDTVIKLGSRHQFNSETGLEEGGDVAFSDVEMPKIEDLKHSKLYELILSEHPSSSSDNTEESSGHDDDDDDYGTNKKPSGPGAPQSDFSILTLLDNPDDDYLLLCDDDGNCKDDNAEAEEETTTIESTTFKTAEDEEISRRMKELLGPHMEVDYVFRTDPEWRKLTEVEKVPKQIRLKNPIDPRGFHPRLKLALLDYKAMREEARLKREQELTEEIRRNVKATRKSLFATYPISSNRSLISKKSSNKTNASASSSRTSSKKKKKRKKKKSKKSVYELTPLSVKQRQVSFLKESASIVEVP